VTDGTLSAAWRAIGTGVRVVVSEGDLETARAAVIDVLADVDLALSRFRDDSELAALNARSGTDVAVSPLLGDAIAAGLRAARLTGGAVDPTVGRAMRLIGYDLDFEALARTGAPLEVRFEAVPGWRSVTLAPDRRSVRVRRGVEIDLGSVGKALAADLAASRALASTGSGGVLVSLGGDIAVAGEPPSGGWRVLVAEDSEAPIDGPGDVITIQAGAVATSSTTLRRWRRGDRTLHHLVDPRTGAPVESPWRTASVAAATCVDANTAATAAIVLGEGAIAWLANAGLAARLVGTDGDVVRVGGWPEPSEPAQPAAAVTESTAIESDDRGAAEKVAQPQLGRSRS
jgi:thiamine biosynthesis lipoprotein ApbE